jgi:PQQ-like domain
MKEMQGLLQTNSNCIQDDHGISDFKHEGKSLPYFDASHPSQISSSLSDIPVTEIVDTHPGINPLSQQPHPSHPTLLQPPREVMTDQLQSSLPKTTVLSSDTSLPFSSSSSHLAHPPLMVSSNDSCPRVSTTSALQVGGSVPTKRTDRQVRFSRDILFLSVALALFLALSIENLVLRFPTTVNIFKNFPISVIPAVPSYTTAMSAAENAYNTDTSTNGIMFGFNAAHTNWNSFEKILSTTNVSSLRPNWMYPTGSTGSSPAVANGVVYVSSNDGKLYAFDAHCKNVCQPLWSYTTGGIIDSSPAVANGVVYIGSNDGKLYAFDAHCKNVCQPLWSYFIGGIVGSSPVVANGVVYIGSDKLYAFGLT